MRAGEGGRGRERAGGGARRLALGALIASIACGAGTQVGTTSSRPLPPSPALISTDTLAAWQSSSREFRLIDVRPDIFTYLAGHLPDAVFLHRESLRGAESGLPHRSAAGGLVWTALQPARHPVGPPGGGLQRRRVAGHRRDVPRMAARGAWPSRGVSARRRPRQVGARGPDDRAEVPAFRARAASAYAIRSRARGAGGCAGGDRRRRRDSGGRAAARPVRRARPARRCGGGTSPAR